MHVKFDDFGPGLLLDSHICCHWSFCCTWKKTLTPHSDFLHLVSSSTRVCAGCPGCSSCPLFFRELQSQQKPLLHTAVWPASYSWWGPHETPSAGNHSHWTPESPSSLSFWMYQILWYKPILRNKSSWLWWTGYEKTTCLAKGTILLPANILVFLDRKTHDFLHLLKTRFLNWHIECKWIVS